MPSHDFPFDARRPGNRWDVRLPGAAIALVGVTALSGCNTSEPLRMEAAFELKGSITMQIQGPVVRYEGTFISEALFEMVKESETSES